jgi:hypothetical protein
MFLFVVAGIAILSLLLALLSLWKQNKLEELKGVRKDLKRKKVIYHKDSSAASSTREG